MVMASPRSRAGIENIQRRMAQIRLDLHEDVRGAVRGARSIADWRSLVVSYPWWSLGAAATLGYLIVPTRRRTPPAGLAATAPAGDAPLGAAPQAQMSEPPRSRWAVLATGFSLLAPVVVRAGQNYLLKQVEGWLAQHDLDGDRVGQDSRPPARDARPSNTNQPEQPLGVFRGDFGSDNR
jgi:hypothetical protein